MKYSLTIWSSLPYVILPFLCIFFDEALKISWVNKRDLVRALLDNCGHGLIAFLSWLSVAGMSKRGLTESLLCAVMASAIDLDHFVMAKSFTLKVCQFTTCMQNYEKNILTLLDFNTDRLNQ